MQPDTYTYFKKYCRRKIADYQITDEDTTKGNVHGVSI